MTWRTRKANTIFCEKDTALAGIASPASREPADEVAWLAGWLVLMEMES
jgi:hypothetical protein